MRMGSHPLSHSRHVPAAGCSAARKGSRKREKGAHEAYSSKRLCCGLATSTCGWAGGGSQLNNSEAHFGMFKHIHVRPLLKVDHTGAKVV